MTGKTALCIFDFDGTVADTLPLCLECFRIVFRVHNGTVMTDDEIRRSFGPSEEVIIRSLVRDEWARDEPVELFYWLYEDMHDLCIDPASSEPVRQLLGELRRHGCKTVLMTGKGRRSLDISLRKLQMDGLFDLVVTDDDVDEPKPSPAGLLRILHELDTTPGQSLFVGDMDADIEAARRAGVRSVGVSWFTGQPGYRLEPDYRAAEPEDILHIAAG